MNANVLRDLNNLLGRELGRRVDGHSIFKWKNSDDLMWPAFKTGRKTLTRIEVPLLAPIEVTCPDCDGLGTETDGDDESVIACSGCGGKGAVTKTSDFFETTTDEYRSDRQMRALDTWVMTKWLNPEELIWGWIGKHGQPTPGARPSHEKLVEMWNSRFPGADFPHNGWRVPTDATLPRSPHDPREPNLNDTRYFIACVKEQTRLNAGERLKDMLDSEDRVEAGKMKRIEDDIRDSFGAFLNPKPGARGGFISFPFSKRDRS